MTVGCPSTCRASTDSWYRLSSTVTLSLLSSGRVHRRSWISGLGAGRVTSWYLKEEEEQFSEGGGTKVVCVCVVVLTSPRSLGLWL